MADLALAVTSLGLTACKGLIHALNAWIDHGKDIQETRLQIEALSNLLISLRPILQNPSNVPTVLILDRIISCQGGLQKLQEKAKHIESWRVRSHETRLVPHLNYPFTRSSLTELRELTRHLQSELNLAMQAAILLVYDELAVCKY